MSSPCDHEAILARFRNRREKVRDEAIHDAHLDAHADQLMARMLDESADSRWEKVVVAAGMGDLTGPAGDAALRRAIEASGPRTTDLRCASLLALAKRLGPLASPDLLAALSSTNTAVKDYAVIGLAGAGDDRAWEPVLAYLHAVLRRQRRTAFQSQAALAIAYLAQHVAEPNRCSGLVAFIRQHWAAIDEATWFAELWPQATPGGPDVDGVTAPEPGPIRAWARHPLFTPLTPRDLS